MSVLRPPSVRHVLAYGTFAMLLANCSTGDDATTPQDVTAEVSENISTVVNVSWTTTEPTRGYVQYGPTEAMEFNTPLESEATKEHEMTLLGLTSDTEYFYRVVTWDGDDAGASAADSIRTGDLPVGMPPLTVEGEGYDMFTVVPILGAKTAVTIINPEGKIVWYHTDERELDFYRARLSVDGKSLLYNAGSVSGDPADNSEMVRVALDGSGSTSTSVPLLAHDFVEHADGTIGAIVVEYRDFEGVQVRGDKIVEIDLEGNQTDVWSAWDCFDPAVDVNVEPNGWTFANALDFDEAQNVYYLGMRNFSSITRIDRATGTCEWVLGATAGTFEFAQGSERFLHQHQFQVRGDHIIVLDNDGAPGAGGESRVLEYQLDLETNVATQVWSYVSDPKVYTFVLGEPIRFNDGSTLVNWSAAGQMELVNPEGQSIWKMNTGATFVFAFNTVEENLYPRDAEMP